VTSQYIYRNMKPTIIGATVVGMISSALTKVKYGILDDSAKAMNSPIVISIVIPIKETRRVLRRDAMNGVKVKAFLKLSKPINI